jgi:hypothetical protein
MAPKFTKGSLPESSLIGFDAQRTLQVLQIGKKTSIYLSDGADANVQVSNASADQGRTIVSLEEVDEAKLARHEKAANLRKFILTGSDLGATRITADSPLTTPLQVIVSKDPNGREFDGSNNVVPPQVLLPLKAFGLRGAALRIAEDQLVSSIGRTSGKGAGMYMKGSNEDGSLYDWCGGFAQWCYQTAAQLIGETNPFGDTAWALASPERAISWALAHPSLATVIRYKGVNPMGADGKLYGMKGTRPESQDQLVDMEVADHGNPANITEGDICLTRKPDGSWQHVSTVYNVAGSSTFDTMNGNPSIWIQKGLKYGDKVGKDYKYSFLHLSLPPVDWIAGWTAESQVANGS